MTETLTVLEFAEEPASTTNCQREVQTQHRCTAHTKLSRSEKKRSSDSAVARRTRNILKPSKHSKAHHSIQRKARPMLELAERSMGHRVSSDSRGYTMRRPTKKRLDRHTDHSAELFVLHQLELENDPIRSTQSLYKIASNVTDQINTSKSTSSRRDESRDSRETRLSLSTLLRRLARGRSLHRVPRDKRISHRPLRIDTEFRNAPEISPSLYGGKLQLESSRTPCKKAYRSNFRVQQRGRLKIYDIPHRADSVAITKRPYLHSRCSPIENDVLPWQAFIADPLPRPDSDEENTETLEAGTSYTASQSESSTSSDRSASSENGSIMLQWLHRSTTSSSIDSGRRGTATSERSQSADPMALQTLLSKDLVSCKRSCSSTRGSRQGQAAGSFSNISLQDDYSSHDPLQRIAEKRSGLATRTFSDDKDLFPGRSLPEKECAVVDQYRVDAVPCRGLKTFLPDVTNTGEIGQNLYPESRNLHDSPGPRRKCSLLYKDFVFPCSGQQSRAEQVTGHPSKSNLTEAQLTPLGYRKRQKLAIGIVKRRHTEVLRRHSSPRDMIKADLHLTIRAPTCSTFREIHDAW